MLFALFALCFVLFVAFISLPVLDGPKGHANEAASVSMLRTLNSLQNNYAAAHPTIGFACELARLKPAEPVKDPYFEEFLVTGERSGYNFAITDCHADQNGVVTHYQITAVPRKPGKSGIRAFCTDESGLFWYDSAGSAANCLASGRQLSWRYAPRIELDSC